MVTLFAKEKVVMASLECKVDERFDGPQHGFSYLFRYLYVPSLDSHLPWAELQLVSRAN